MVRLKHKLIKLIALKWSPLNNRAVIILKALQAYKKIWQQFDFSALEISLWKFQWYWAC